MWFWWFMFICTLTIPFALIAGGRMMWKHCPGDINAIVGYRTKRSMKNMDTWRYAHDYCGRLWWKAGWAMLLPTILLQIPFFYCTEDMIAIVGTVIGTVQCIILFVSIILTEKALKKHFNL